MPLLSLPGRPAATLRANLLAALFTFPALLSPHAVRAHDDCDFDLDAELAVGPERIVIDDRRLGEVVIRDDGVLAIDGDEVDLDDDQRASVQAWATQLREVVPIIVDVALEGVEIGITAVTEVFAGLLGQEPPAAVRESLDRMRTEVGARVGREDDVWYVRGDGITNVDEAMAELEPWLEEAVAGSIGALLITLGRSMADGDGTLEENLARFSARMDGLGEEIEARIERDASVLEAKGGRLCAQMTVLASREETMRSRVPELARLRVIEGR